MFELIHSMTPSEKRYFRTRIPGIENGDERKYLQLFEVLNSIEKYDRDTVLLKTPKLKPEQLPNLKARLYQSLLRSLHAYHTAGSQSRFRISELRSHIEILYNKGLFAQALRTAIRAKERVYEYEHYELLPEILWWEREARYQTSASFTDMEQELARNSEEQKHVAQIISNLTALSTLRYRAYSLFSRKGRIVRDSEKVAQLRKLVNEAQGFLRSNLTFREERTIHHILIQSYMMLADCDHLLDHCIALNSLFEQEPRRKQIYFNQYLRCLNSYAIALNMAEEFDEALRITTRTRILPQTIGIRMAKAQLGEIFDCYAFHRLETYIWTGRFEEGVQLIPELEKGLKTYQAYMNPVNIHSKYYRIALAYFGAGRYRESLQWINTILNNSRAFRQDIQSGVRILNLILHFELHNLSLLEYAVKSTYRYLNNIKGLYETENILLRFLRSLPEIQNRRMLRDAFKELLEEMNVLFRKDPLEKYAIPYFDITSWLEGKVSERTFAECVQLKHTLRSDNRLSE